MLTMIDEEIDMDSDQVSAEIERRGKIVVSVVRGNYVPTLFRTLAPIPLVGHQAPETVKSSTAVVKKNNVSHTVKYVTWSRAYGMTANKNVGTLPYQMHLH